LGETLITYLIGLWMRYVMSWSLWGFEPLKKLFPHVKVLREIYLLRDGGTV